MPEDLYISIQVILPLIVLAAWACVLLLVDLFIPEDRKGWTAILAAAGLLVTLVITLVRSGTQSAAFGGMIIVDGFSIFVSCLLLISGLAAIALAHDYLQRTELEHGEYYPLLLFAVLGMILIAMAADLMVVFLALELLSIPLYILAGVGVPRVPSEEASIKYFLLGAFSSGFVVYGTALVYGATGTTRFKEIAAAFAAGTYDPSLIMVGAALFMVGLSFKVAVVPFHMWTPDVYHGAPSSVTAFMAIGAKAAGFAALLRMFVLVLPSLSFDFSPVFWALATLTMILGNVVAIAQGNIKRLLAYSSIAHAGYIMMALVPYGQAAIAPATVASALFYLVAYAFTNFAAWSVVIALERQGDQGLRLEDFAGLGRSHPGLALVMAVAMLSFIGVPPTLGFFGKFYLFSTVISGGYIGLAIIGVLTSLVSAYYYLRIIVIMYMREGEPVVRKEPWLYLTAFTSALGIIVLSIFSTPLIGWASQALLQLL
jgi:NADH-quinone oxidoreductase subunit N